MVSVIDAPLETLEQQIRTALRSGNLEGLRTTLATVPFPDLADVLERLDAPSAAQVFRQVPINKSIYVLHELGTDATRKLFAQLSKEEIAVQLNHMAMDNVAEIFTKDVPERQEELLNAMQPADADEVRNLLK